MNIYIIYLIPWSLLCSQGHTRAVTNDCTVSRSVCIVSSFANDAFECVAVEACEDTDIAEALRIGGPAHLCPFFGFPQTVQMYVFFSIVVCSFIAITALLSRALTTADTSTGTCFFLIVIGITCSTLSVDPEILNLKLHFRHLYFTNVPL